MLKVIFKDGERVSGFFATRHRAAIAATDAFVARLRQTTAGKINIMRRRGRTPDWREVGPLFDILPAVAEWIDISPDGEETPDGYTEEGSLLFVDRKKQETHLGFFTEEHYFVDQSTGKEFAVKNVQQFFIVPEK